LKRLGTRGSNKTQSVKLSFCLTKLALTLPTSGGRSVGTVCLRTKATELIKHHAMKTESIMDVQTGMFLTSAGVEYDYSVSLPANSSPDKETPYPLDRRLGEPQSSLDDVEKKEFLTIPRLELRTPCSPICWQFLHRLCYRSS
jgi:hypothetical protein